LAFNSINRRDFIHKESGFTLIEMAIVIIITGLIIIALINAYLTWNYILKSSKTKETIEVITDAMSAYASRNYRIPCPASPAAAGPEPFGAEIGSGADTSELNGCPANSEGILPFVTLGLDASFAVDGWGRYFTYQVSPQFTRNLDLAPASDNILVHAKCRTTEWFEGVQRVGNGPLTGGRAFAQQKARFCCMLPDVTTNVQIRTTSAADTPADLPAIITQPDANEWYKLATVIADPYLDDASNPIAEGDPDLFYDERLYGGGVNDGTGTDVVYGYTDFPVYALISHGENGAGAYIVNGTTDRLPDSQGLSEQVNASDANIEVYDLEHNSSSGAAYYDDIVSWQTQSNLIARLRRDSCAVP